MPTIGNYCIIPIGFARLRPSGILMISVVGMAHFCGQKYEATHVVVQTHSSLLKLIHQSSNTFIIVQTASIDVQTRPSNVHRCSGNPPSMLKNNAYIDVQTHPSMFKNNTNTSIFLLPPSQASACRQI